MVLGDGGDAALSLFQGRLFKTIILVYYRHFLQSYVRPISFASKSNVIIAKVVPMLGARASPGAWWAYVRASIARHNTRKNATGVIPRYLLRQPVVGVFMKPLQNVKHFAHDETKKHYSVCETTFVIYGSCSNKGTCTDSGEGRTMFFTLM